MKSLAFSLPLSLSLLAAPALASQLSYAPVNPTFQPGNPYASSTFLAVADAQKKTRSTSTASGASARSVAETVRSAFISRLTTTIYNQVFDADNAAGNFDLGDGSSITYSRGGGDLVITFVDPVNGTTTITVPDSGA